MAHITGMDIGGGITLIMTIKLLKDSVFMNLFLVNKGNDWLSYIIGEYKYNLYYLGSGSIK